MAPASAPDRGRTLPTFRMVVFAAATPLRARSGCRAAATANTTTTCMANGGTSQRERPPRPAPMRSRGWRGLRGQRLACKLCDFTVTETEWCGCRLLEGFVFACVLELADDRWLPLINGVVLARPALHAPLCDSWPMFVIDLSRAGLSHVPLAFFPPSPPHPVSTSVALGAHTVGRLACTGGCACTIHGVTSIPWLRT
jgi:hypothetical protein